MIDLHTFQRYADTYGGDLSRWPKELLSPAIATLKTHPEAETILLEALAFDMSIAAMPVPPVDYALRAKILEIPREAALPDSMRRMMTPQRIAIGLALFALLGLSVGMTQDTIAPSHAVRTAWVLTPEQSVEYDYAMLD